jgi:hypothetical protein
MANTDYADNGVLPSRGLVSMIETLSRGGRSRRETETFRAALRTLLGRAGRFPRATVGGIGSEATAEKADGAGDRVLEARSAEYLKNGDSLPWLF